jgi:hypothetical protein
MSTLWCSWYSEPRIPFALEIFFAKENGMVSCTHRTNLDISFLLVWSLNILVLFIIMQISMDYCLLQGVYCSHIICMYLIPLSKVALLWFMLSLIMPFQMPKIGNLFTSSIVVWSCSYG